MNYYNTFIVIAEDSPVQKAVIPSSRRQKPTLAEVEYELLKEHPKKWTQEEFQFEAHMRHKNIPEEKRASAKMEYDKKSHACMRASALPKKFGWGLYFDGKGKVELVAVDSERYNQLVGTQGLKIVKAMKSKS
ncbi:DUF6157 family protein [Salibacterium aidingense]|uniref:DUF6157 family protein n=1 Tax=Salibacterium aidingense TaxID=384933 RepID=UPI00041E6724|nr:DUF6157 family protein [Salibacterium aidingense]